MEYKNEDYCDHCGELVPEEELRQRECDYDGSVEELCEACLEDLHWGPVYRYEG